MSDHIPASISLKLQAIRDSLDDIIEDDPPPSLTGNPVVDIALHNDHYGNPAWLLPPDRENVTAKAAAVLEAAKLIESVGGRVHFAVDPCKETASASVFRALIQQVEWAGTVNDGKSIYWYCPWCESLKAVHKNTCPAAEAMGWKRAEA